MFILKYFTERVGEIFFPRRFMTVIFLITHNMIARCNYINTISIELFRVKANANNKTNLKQKPNICPTPYGFNLVDIYFININICLHFVVYKLKLQQIRENPRTLILLS